MDIFVFTLPELTLNHHRFHEVAALRALMLAARTLRENGNEIYAGICICGTHNYYKLSL